MLDNQYHITSNREAGNGRFDIQMLPLNKKTAWYLNRDKKQERIVQKNSWMNLQKLR